MKKLLLQLTVMYIMMTPLYAADWLAYTQYSGNYWQIWVYNVSTGEDNQLTDTLYDKKSPVWSTDGTRILFRTSNGELFIIDTETREESQIFKDISYCADPSWISDNKVLLTRYRTDIIDDSDIWLVDMLSGKRSVLVSEAGLQYQPSLSGDGKKLYYVKAHSPKNHHIYVNDITSGKDKCLTQASGYNYMPCVSPDGTEIVFVSDQTGNNEVWVMDLNRKSIKQLTENNSIDVDPKWMDDENIVYSAFMDGIFQINTINVETLEMKTLIKKNVDCCNPDWINK